MDGEISVYLSGRQFQNSVPHMLQKYGINQNGNVKQHYETKSITFVIVSQ